MSGNGIQEQPGILGFREAARTFPFHLLSLICAMKAFLLIRFPERTFLPAGFLEGWEVVPDPALGWIARLIWLGIFAWVARFISRPPDKRTGVVRFGKILYFNLGSLFLFLLLFALRISTGTRNVPYLLFGGYLTVGEAASFLLVKLLDPPYPGAFILFFIVLTWIFRHNPGRAVALPFVLFLCAELLGFGVFSDYRLPGIFLIFSATHCLLALNAGLSPLGLLGQGVPVFLSFLPFILTGTLRGKYIPFLLIVLVANLFLVGLGRINRDHPEYTRLSWMVPFGVAPIAFQIPPHLLEITKLSFVSYLLPGIIFQEILILAILWRYVAGAGGRLKNLPALLLTVCTCLWGVASFVDFRIYQLLDTRLTTKVIRFGGELGVAMGSIAPYLDSTFFLWCGLVLLLGFVDFRAMVSGALPSPRRGKWLVLILFSLHLAPFLLGWESALWPSVPYNLLVRPLGEAVLPSGRTEIQDLYKEVAVDRWGFAGVASPPPRLWNLLLVICESLNPDQLSLYGSSVATQPRLRGWAPRMRLFNQFFCNFPGSENAYFTILNGLYAGPETPGNLPPDFSCPSLFRILSEKGYKTSYFYSSDTGYRGFSRYLRMCGVDEVFDMKNLPGRERYPVYSWGIDERCTRNGIEDRILAHQARGERFFITYVPTTPHHPFEPVEWMPRTFKPSPDDPNFDLELSRAKYRNLLLAMDSVYADLLDFLERKGLLDSTLVVFVGDHGEALGDEGWIGHGYKVVPRLVNVFAAFIEPGRREFLLDSTLGSQVDLLPTILDSLRVPTPAGHLYQGRSLLGSPEGRSVFISSMQEGGFIASGTFWRISANGRVLKGSQTARPGLLPDWIWADEAGTDRVTVYSRWEAHRRMQPEFLERYDEVREFSLRKTEVGWKTWTPKF